MKLRCTTNSIRLRLRKSDLETLVGQGMVSESIRFTAGNLLRFTVRSAEQALPVKVTFGGETLEIALTKRAVKQWAGTSQVGLEYEIDLPEGESLHVLVEKDFPCLDRESEDKSDTFWELAPDQSDNC